MKTEKIGETAHSNPDAITGAPGSHPGATAIGSASGAATGAALGAIGGPVGAVIGAIAGGVVGGWGGHSIGEWNDPSDAAYWKDEYKNRSYFDKTANYEQDVTPALQYGSALGMGSGNDTDKGATGSTRQPQSSFESLEDKAMKEWDKVRGKSKYSYEQARSAISDAYNRKVNQAQSGVEAKSTDAI